MSTANKTLHESIKSLLVSLVSYMAKFTWKLAGVCSPDVVLCWQRLAHRDGERQRVAGLPSHPLGQRPHLPTMKDLTGSLSKNWSCPSRG
jgi:hypothetical protein